MSALLFLFISQVIGREAKGVLAFKSCAPNLALKA